MAVLVLAWEPNRRLVMPDGQTIPEMVRLVLFRICLYAVSNVIRHSGATNLTVQFSYDPKQVLLVIEDDGYGFELPDRWIEIVRTGHLGLTGTAERVQAIGGHLEIISAPGKGTVIRITAPLNQEVEEDFIYAYPSPAEEEEWSDQPKG